MKVNLSELEKFGKVITVEQICYSPGNQEISFMAIISKEEINKIYSAGYRAALQAHMNDKPEAVYERWNEDDWKWWESGKDLTTED